MSTPSSASVKPEKLDEIDELEKPKMTHRQVLEALSGLLLGMFVSILASTVVSTSLPVIIHDLGGTQAAFTWVVTATLLTTAISHPDLGQARRPVQPQAAHPDRDRDLRARHRRRRVLAESRDAHRIPRRAGHRRRRPRRAQPGHHGRHHQPARARPVHGTVRRGHGRRHDRRPAPRRRHHRHARVALELLRRAPVRDRSRSSSCSAPCTSSPAPSARSRSTTSASCSSRSPSRCC